MTLSGGPQVICRWVFLTYAGTPHSLEYALDPIFEMLMSQKPFSCSFLTSIDDVSMFILEL